MKIFIGLAMSLFFCVCLLGQGDDLKPEMVSLNKCLFMESNLRLVENCAPIVPPVKEKNKQEKVNPVLFKAVMPKPWQDMLPV